MAKKVIRYSSCFKRNVVAAIEKEGISIEECRRRYGIKGSVTIQRWLRSYGKNELLAAMPVFYPCIQGRIDPQSFF
ncbi:MAG: transposase [Prevotellaceae bacterium]|nr:transposase [Prevotellaceae bacterium]